jgi:hypothetical protein
MAKKNYILWGLFAAGILAIALSVYVRYGVPYLELRANEKLDRSRVADMDALSQYAGKLTGSNPGVTLGTPKTVYLSLVSSHADCSDLSLPALPTGWSYHCSDSSRVANADGTGWVPFDFSANAAFAGTVQKLPVDSVNDPSSFAYYAFVTDKVFSGGVTTTQWVFSAPLLTSKYRALVAEEKSGTDPFRYEVGNNLRLWAEARGLLAYWPLNEGEGGTIHDRSGNALDGEMIGFSGWQKDGSFKFAGGDTGKNYFSLKTNPKINQLGKVGTSYSIVLWIKSPEKKDQSITEKWVDAPSYPWAIRIDKSNIVFAVYDGSNWIGAYTNAATLYDGAWHRIVSIKDANAKVLKMYIDDALVSSVDDTLETDSSNNNDFTIGSRDKRGNYNFSGFMRDVMLFNKALNENDLRRYERSF